MDARFALLLGCFLLSGFAALLYQTAWTRELSFVFGTSELAVAAVLAAYMGGLALGAAVAARYAGRLRRPVLAYGVLELAIALSALSVPLAIRAINAGYVAWFGGQSDLPESGASLATLFQLGAAFAVLLPPTVFMGATLPLLARHAVRSDAEIGSRVGVLYAVNTAGAIAGTLCAAFWLMPALGLRGTVWVGAALNGIVFALAAQLARGAANPPAEAPRVQTAADGARWILPAIALSGAVSFAYEVLWTRLLGHLLGGSLDAFATMLASFLLGIALGSAVAARLATSRERAALGFGLAQLGIACIGYAAFALADRLPELSRRLGAGPEDPLASAGVAIATLLPITLCIGATFPFAVRLLARSPEQASRATARVYAWNTVGAIAGALGAGFELLPRLGFEGTVTVCVAASLVLAAVTALASRPRRGLVAAVAAAAGVVLAVLPARAPWALLKSSPFSTSPPRAPVFHSAVGRSCTVLLLDQGDLLRLYSNGLPEAVIERIGFQPLPEIARLMGMLPVFLRPEARELLLIGLGGGTVLELIPSSIRSIDVIELEPEVLRANQKVAALRAHDPLADPRVRVHIGDARGVLQLTDKRYDAIVSQPSHPWTAGASHLYTREFFAIVRSHLKPDGVFVQWIGLNFVDEPLLRSLAAALIEAFGHVEAYQVGATPGLLFAASAEPFDSLENARRALQENPEDFARVGFQRIEDFAPIRLLDEAGVRKLAEGGVPNTDDRNFLAARAARLGDDTLSDPAARVLWKHLDPLLAGTDGLDRYALIRRLVATNHVDRATALALTSDGALQETGLGWVEVGQARLGRAVRHFERALKLDPGSSEATSGLVMSRFSDLTAGKPVEGISEARLEPRVAAVIAGWRRAAANDWDAVAALDGELARFQPGEALFHEAGRLRARWRLAADGSERSAEAQAIMANLLARKWMGADAILYARAAVAAGRPIDAWGSLSEFARMIGRNPQLRAQIPVALAVSRQLPEDLARSLGERLQRAGADPSRPGEEQLAED
jgi:spermidine synthase